MYYRMSYRRIIAVLAGVVFLLAGGLAVSAPAGATSGPPTPPACTVDPETGEDVCTSSTEVCTWDDNGETLYCDSTTVGGFDTVESTSSAGYRSTVTCYPNYNRNPGTWMKVSSWPYSNTRRYHVAVRESIDGGGTQWQRAVIGGTPSVADSGVTMRWQSRYDTNPLEFYYNYGYPDGYYMVKSIWRYVVAYLPQNYTSCYRYR